MPRLSFFSLFTPLLNNREIQTLYPPMSGQDTTTFLNTPFCSTLHSVTYLAAVI